MQRAPFYGLYSRAEEAAAEKEWRYKQAAKMHESAHRKGQIMDWKSAIEDIEKAKQAIPIEEAQPFFWKKPETWLKNMEAARIASRNWARAQQPRAGDRSGD